MLALVPWVILGISAYLACSGGHRLSEEGVSFRLVERSSACVIVLRGKPENRRKREGGLVRPLYPPIWRFLRPRMRRTLSAPSSYAALALVYLIRNPWRKRCAQVMIETARESDFCVEMLVAKLSILRG